MPDMPASLPNSPQDLRGLLDRAVGSFLPQQMRDGKGKGGASQPPPMVPQAGAGQGFYQPMDPAARQALLRAMMARSRLGRQAGA